MNALKKCDLAAIFSVKQNFRIKNISHYKDSESLFLLIFRMHSKNKCIPPGVMKKVQKTRRQVGGEHREFRKKQNRGLQEKVMLEKEYVRF